MTEITMPRLSDSMDQGTILAWLKGDGDRVEAGDDLLEIETDKATMTHAADAAGVLTIIAAAGTTLAVGAPIARLGVAPHGEPDDPPGDDAPSDDRPASAAVTGNGRPPDAPTVRATPLARRAAQAHGVRLGDVAGSGPLARITRADVLASAGQPLVSAPRAAPGPAPAAERRPAPAAERRPAPERPPVVSDAPHRLATPGPDASAKGPAEVIELTTRQSVIARRMAEAKATVPHFQVQTEVAMDAAIAFRDQLKAAGGAPSFNDLIVKAAALALRDHPLANGAYREGRFERYPRVNVGIAVATEGALVVPTIFDADEKSLGTIAAEARRLAARVRDDTVTPPELSGATFTVSNLGMYGMTAIMPVINLPQAAILGVGVMRQTLARVDGAIVDLRLMTLTLSCDHRILYGADAARLLSSMRELLQQPLRLAL